MARSVTFNPSPKFDNPGSSFVTLAAPCGFDDYMHQDRVELFMRNEDSDKGLHTTVDGFLITQDRDMSANPSSRRHGMRIHFICELCGTNDVPGHHILAIAQHKGNTHVEWEK